MIFIVIKNQNVYITMIYIVMVIIKILEIWINVCILHKLMKINIFVVNVNNKNLFIIINVYNLVLLILFYPKINNVLINVIWDNFINGKILKICLFVKILVLNHYIMDLIIFIHQ